MRILRSAAPATVVFLLLLGATGLLTPATLPGLPISPVLTLLLVPTLRLVMFASGAVAVGGAVLGGLLGGSDRARAIGTRAAYTFAAVSVLVAVATLADVLAVQWWNALKPTMLLSFLTQIDEGRYLMLQAVLAVSAALMLQRVEHAIDSTFAFLLILTAAVLPGFTGHSTAAVTHWLASATMIAHLGGMTVWVGSVVVLAATADVAALRAFKPVAISAYVVVMLSGVASLFTRIADWTAFWHDRYALVLAAKVLLAIVLGAFGANMRNRVSAAAADDTAKAAAVRVLGIEATLMAVVLAFAVVLARMPNP